MKRKMKTKYKKVLLLLTIALMVISCKSGDTMTEAERTKALTDLTEQLTNNDFRVAIEVMQPFNTAATTAVLNQLTPYSNGNSTGRINVAGDGHYLEISQTEVKGNMPYMGQQLQGGGRTIGRADIGVDMDGKMRDKTVRIDQNKGKVVLEFNTDDPKNRAENYNVIITTFLNKSVVVQVSSSLRTNIRYTGRLITGDASI